MTSILSKWNKTRGVTVLNMNLAQFRLISPRNSLNMLWVLYLADYSNSQRLFYKTIDKSIHWTQVHWRGTCEMLTDQRAFQDCFMRLFLTFALDWAVLIFRSGPIKCKVQSTSYASRYQRNVKGNSCYSLVSYHQGKQYLNYWTLF